MTDANGWLPIRMAPKDGKDRIDLWHKDGYRLTDCYWTQNRKRHCGTIETGWTGSDINPPRKQCSRMASETATPCLNQLDEFLSN